MFSNLRTRLKTKHFEFVCRDILRTKRVEPGTLPVTVVSMVRSEHTLMYLLAIKSFLRHVPASAVTVLDDGSLTPADHDLLRAHVGGLSIVPIASIDTGTCPRGGCWERLLYILDLSATRYVVQLDSDILTIAPIPEVVEAFAANRSFTLGSDAQFGIVTTQDAARAIAGSDPAETQFAAEFALPRMPPEIGRFYVRGSAGFAGFARGATSRATAEAFSAAMEAEMGKRWEEWGTEQVASNFLIASSPGGFVLPWPKYACFYAEDDASTSALLHFIGTWRFKRGVYARLGQRVVAELLSQAKAA
ncbi:MAG: hypothetical protein MUC89_09495 [Acetobacteraceae bacterium]|jgi:hypothetical protein|nr:hypothetical protein [Acetobacteraceae bacterium]